MFYLKKSLVHCIDVSLLLLDDLAEGFLAAMLGFNLREI